MDILIRSARIINTGSKFHQRVCDILISNGIIKKIAPQIQHTAKAQEVKADRLHVSLGWFDLNTFLADPGYEQKETIKSGCAAAAAGGFTHICAMPNTAPVVQTKSLIDYILKKSASEPVSVHPIGAVTQDLAGKDLAEMYDMHKAGALAFSDGWKPIASAGTVARALLYVKTFDGLIMLHPEDVSISQHGVMHEGKVSTRMGLPGLPAFAEEMAVNRDLYILAYTNSRLHFFDISTAGSVALLRAAKKKKQTVSASVNAYNLLLSEEQVGNYNTHCKVNPPLRAQEDIQALLKGIEDGTIDTITSAHHPQDEESKKMEFDRADFGMIGLETCYAVANTALQKKSSTEKIIQLLAENPRKIMGQTATIAEGEVADLTLFDPDLTWTFTTDAIRSTSKNTPFTGKEFCGKALGIIHKGKLVLN